MTNDIGTIAVIVATYNSESTVIETLESIKQQTYKKIELIITDDASTDNTVAIVKKWLEKQGARFERYECCVGKENSGIAANVNRGVRCAKSSLYKLIAADDILFPDAIRTYAEFWKQKENCLYVSNVKLIFADTCTKEFRKQEIAAVETNFLDNKKSSKKKKVFARKMLKANRINASAIGLISKQMYEDNNGYDERFSMMEDYPFSLKLIKKNIQIVFLDQKLVGYRIHENSVSHSTQNQISLRYEKCKIDFFFEYRMKEMIKKGMFLSFLFQYKYFARRNKEIKNNYN